MKYKGVAFLLIVFLTAPVMGQIGGLRSFDFLTIPGDARTSALGGSHVSTLDADVNSFVNNPSLLDSGMVHHGSLSYLSFLGGIKFTNLSFAHNHKKLGLWGGHLKYLNYGTLESFDPSGQSLGEFSSNEFVIGFSHSRTTGVFSYGATLKFALSNFAGYKANGILLDMGGQFKHPDKQLKVGLIFKNIGWLFKDYTELSTTDLPFDVQLGISFKPEYMPFRLSATVYNLYLADIAYFDPNGLTNTPDDTEPGIGDKIFRHMLFALEFVPTENFNLRFGYNHLMRRELRLEEASGGAGLSFGIMFRVKAFSFAYSKAFYHVAGSTNHLTVTSNFDRLLKKH